MRVHVTSVHPRVHGDNLPAWAMFADPFGSPPCARGQRAEIHCRQERRPVHPRVHGDNFVILSMGMELGGSPPCARGQHALDPEKWAAYWFTPVCTGTTADTLHMVGTGAVHPRVHGDN